MNCRKSLTFFWISLMVVMLFCGFVHAGDGSGVPSGDASDCNTVAIVGHYTLVFNGVTYDGAANTSRWDYTLTWNGTPPGLSHFGIGVCGLLTDANLVVSEPAGAGIGNDGSIGLYTVKWDNIQGFPAHTPVDFSFTLDRTYGITSNPFAAKAGTSPNIGSICGPDLDCSHTDTCDIRITCPPDITIECHERTDPSRTGMATASGACGPNGGAACICEGGLKVIELQTSLAYSGEVTSVEARAARKDRLETEPYGVDTETFDGTTFTSETYSGAVAISRMEAHGGSATVTMVVDAGLIGMRKLDSEAEFRVTFGSEQHQVRIHTSCSQPIGPPFVFGDFTLLSFVTKNGQTCPGQAFSECGEHCIDTITYSDEITPGPSPDEYTILRTWVAVDRIGARASCVQVITVRDTTSPTCHLPIDTLIALCASEPVCLPVFAADVCDEDVACRIAEGPGVLTDDHWCYTPSHPEEVTVTVVCEDDAGNTCRGAFTVTFVVNEPPQVAFGNDTTIGVCGPERICLPYRLSDPQGLSGLVETLVYGDARIDTSANRICFTAASEGSHMFVVRVTDPCDSFDEDTIFVHVSLGDGVRIACPGPQRRFLCEPGPVCVPVRIEGDRFDVDVSPIGRYQDGRVCFPADTSGQYRLQVVARSDCGADTCGIVVGVTFNSPPVCVVPNDTTIVQCGPTRVCLPVFADDPDGNLHGCEIHSGPGSLFDGRWCYTPQGHERVAVVVKCIDSCRAECQARFAVRFVVGQPPRIAFGEDTSVTLCEPTRICLPYTVDNPDGGPTIITLVEGNGEVDEDHSRVCFTPTSPGPYRFIIHIRGECGAGNADTIYARVEFGDRPQIDCPHRPICIELESPDTICYEFRVVPCNVPVTTSYGSYTGCGICFFADTCGTYKIMVIAHGECGADTCIMTFRVDIGGAVAVRCPEPQSRTVCAQQEICVPVPIVGGYTSVAVSPIGYYHRSSVCFFADTSGHYELAVEASGPCGRDGCVVEVDVTVNAPPICVVPSDTTVFQCRPARVCLPAYATDNDGNLRRCEIRSGPGYLHDGTWCYTPTSDEAVEVVVGCFDSCWIGCDARFTVDFDINEAPTLAFGDDFSVSLCSEEEICVPFTASDPDGNASVITLVSGDGVLDRVDSQICFTATTAATYRFIARIEDECGLTGEDTIRVHVSLNTPPVVHLCKDQHVTLCGDLTEVCCPAYCRDVDSNLVECVFEGPGTYDGHQICFRPTESGRYIFVLTARDACGAEDTDTAIITVEFCEPPGGHTAEDDAWDEERPAGFSLAQNFPNPFNPTTEITFALPDAAHVRLDVFNIVGQHVMTLADGSREAGIHTVVFDATAIPSGVYFYRLTAGQFVGTRKMILLK